MSIPGDTTTSDSKVTANDYKSGVKGKNNEFEPLAPQIIEMKMEFVPHTSRFRLINETETVAKLIVNHAQKNTALVKQASQVQEHPFKQEIVVQIQTNGDAPPAEALRQAIDSAMLELETFTKLALDAVSRIKP